jgi:hypothetical protein
LTAIIVTNATIASEADINKRMIVAMNWSGELSSAGGAAFMDQGLLGRYCP